MLFLKILKFNARRALWLLLGVLCLHDLMSEVESGSRKDCPSGPTILFKTSPGRASGSSGDCSSAHLHTLLVEAEGNESEQIFHCGNVTLTCLASSPIVWSYSGLGNPGLSSRSERKDTRNESVCFVAYLTVNLEDNLYQPWIGNYTCSILGEMDEEDIKNPATKSLYLFRNSDQEPKLIKVDRPLRIGVTSSEEISIPCLSNDRELKPELKKIDSALNTEKLLDVPYDPKTGFRVKPLGIFRKEDLLGKYLCTASDSRITVVVDDLLQSRPKLASHFEITFNNQTRKVTCSSTKNLTTPVQLQFLKCKNPLDCDLKMQQKIYLDFHTFHEKYADDPCSQSASKRTSISASLPPSIGTGSDYEGVIICSTACSHHYQYAQFWMEQNHNSMILNPSKVTDPQRLIQIFISKLPPAKLYVNETIDFRCNVSDFLFVTGLDLEVIYKNDSTGNSRHMQLQSNTEYIKGYIQYSWKLNVTTDEIKEYMCKVPQWNSRKWTSVSVNVTVIDGRGPEIVEVDSTEHVFFYDDEEFVTISCRGEGIPAPLWTWYKDELELIDETQNAQTSFLHDQTEVHSATIVMFNKTSIPGSSNIAGTYMCNATNPKGTKLHTIIVTVGSRPFLKITAIVVAAAISGILFLLVFYLNKLRKDVHVRDMAIRKLTSAEKRMFQFGDEELLRRYVNNFEELEKTIGCGESLAVKLPYMSHYYEVDPERIHLDPDNPIKLGEGHYGKVTRAVFHKDNGEKVFVALKELKEWNASHAISLLDELKILAYVGKHDHVVSLVGAITKFDDCKIQVLLEYCAEGSLMDFLRKKSGFFFDEISDDKIQFSSDSAVTETPISSYVRIDYAIRTFDLIRWSYQFACGMQYLSTRKIIHGDLAARNLLLTDTRDLKISDFGLSKKIKESDWQYVSPSPFAQDLPWRSLAPELFTKSNLSSATDVWAYGITLWEIFTLGKEPFPSYPTFCHDFVLALQNGYQNPKPKHATSSIYYVIQSCWHIIPSKRPTFMDLVKSFFNMLPKNYVNTIDLNAYESQNYIQNLAYILHAQLENLQTEEV